MASRAELVRERVQDRPGTLPADFGEWDHGGPPKTLPAEFDGFDPIPVANAIAVQTAPLAQAEAVLVVTEEIETVVDTQNDETIVPQGMLYLQPEAGQAESEGHESSREGIVPVEAPALFASIATPRRWWWR